MSKTTMLSEIFSYESASDDVKNIVLTLRKAKRIETLDVMAEGLEREATNLKTKDDINKAYCIREIEITSEKFV